MTRDSVGGAAQSGTPDSRGSSPRRAATKRQREQWHKQLRKLDRELYWWDNLKRWPHILDPKKALRAEKADQKRKEIRLKLKGYKT